VTASRAALVTYLSNAVRDRDKLDSNSLNKESKFYPIKKLIIYFDFLIIFFSTDGQFTWKIPAY
jgi:hypothetical protein